MEYMAFQRCFTFLHNGLPITTFVSDRHTSIAKHMEKLPHMHHYFDLWHIAKSEYSQTE